MDWNKPWSEELPKNSKSKWNYVFLESFKMALVLPVVILLVEIFILDAWPDLNEYRRELLFDYLFMFSIIFPVFVVYHIIVWHRGPGRPGN